MNLRVSKALGAMAVLGISILWLAGGCGHRESMGRYPPGIWAFGSVESVRPLLDDLRQLEGTPAAKLANEVLGHLEGCERFGWRTSSSLSTLSVAEDGVFDCEGEVPESVTTYLEGAGSAWVLSGPMGRSGGDGPEALSESRTVDRWFLHGEVAGTDVLRQKLKMELPASLGKGPMDLLLPSAEVGDGTLSVAGSSLEASAALIHVRMSMDRPLDPAAWLPSGGAADELFGLRGRLFSRAILDGTWELAVLPPGEEGRLLPVLALGIRSRAAADAAVSSLVDELSRIWGLVPRMTAAGEVGTVSCFAELRLLPGLEPCWRMDDRALVIAWNAGALERALVSPGSGPESSAGGVPSFAKVDLERFAEAEARIERRLRDDFAMSIMDGPESSDREMGSRNAYPWRWWEVEGRRVKGWYRYEIVLE